MPETPSPSPLAWIERVPTRDEIDKQRTHGGYWLALIPNFTPIPTRGTPPEKMWLHPKVAIVSFADVPGGVAIRGSDVDEQHLDEKVLGRGYTMPPEYDHPRGRTRFAPVVLDDAFSPQPAPVE